MFYAKTHLSELVERARQGEVIEITKHGRPVARLVPSDPAASRPSVQEAVDTIRAIRRRVKPGPPFLKDLIEEARHRPWS